VYYFHLAAAPVLYPLSLHDALPISALEELQETVGVSADLEDVLRWRLDVTRRALVPDPGVPETLAELRKRGLGTAIVSNCTEEVDRKSTRLNSSHVSISYAVFCLKK